MNPTTRMTSGTQPRFALAKCRENLSRGFTLIEILVVVAILGVLIAMFAPALTGGREGANAKLLQGTSQKMAQNWALIHQTCGTASAIASNVILAASMTAEDVMFQGSNAVAAAYVNCYKQSKVLPLTEAGQPGSAAGKWNVGSYEVAMSGGGTLPLSITFKAVPDTLALTIAQTYDPKLSTLAASDTTSSVLRYGTATAGARDVTFLRPI